MPERRAALEPCPQVHTQVGPSACVCVCGGGGGQHKIELHSLISNPSY